MMHIMSRFLLSMALGLALFGCASVVKVAPGEALIGERMRVPSDAAWNQFAGNVGASNAAALWTREGLAIDQVNFYVGLKDGGLLATAGKDQRPLTFKATMQPHEVVALFESFYSRDGSSFTLDKLETTDFLGQRGWRAQYTIVRKVDDVRLAGSAWATVRGGELFAITFTAPTLWFYPRQLPLVESLAAAARLKG
jgi:hypothetical protein